MESRKYVPFIISIILLLAPFMGRAQETEVFQSAAPQTGVTTKDLRIKTNLLPWFLTIPNLGLECSIAKKWSISLEAMYCPWKLSDKFSVKTVAILPEGRWWLKSTQKGSFFNIHLNIAWFNVRANDFRYQDLSRPLLGGGIGYGYRLELNRRWGFEFEIGAGMANMKYARYHNIENGALKDNRVTTYWGIDRACISVTYFLCDL